MAGSDDDNDNGGKEKVKPCETGGTPASAKTKNPKSDRRTKLSTAKRCHTRVANQIITFCKEDDAEVEFIEELMEELKENKNSLQKAWEHYLGECSDEEDNGEIDRDLMLNMKARKAGISFRCKKAGEKKGEDKDKGKFQGPSPKVILPDMAPFSGQIRDYPNFKSTFTEKYQPHYGEMAPVILKAKYLTGHELELCKSLKTVQAIFETLDKKFGDSGKLAEVVLGDISRMKACRKNSVKDLEELVQTIRCADIDLQSVGLQHHIQQYHTVTTITERLPKDIRKRWANEIARNAIPTEERYEKIMDFLDLEIRTLQLVDLSDNESSDDHADTQHRGYALHGASRHTRPGTGSPNAGEAKPCPFHQGQSNHHLSRCRLFRVQPVDQQFKFLKENPKICRSCLEEHEGNCAKEIWTCKVDNCGKRHFRFLHDVCAKLRPTDPNAHTYSQKVRKSSKKFVCTISPSQRFRVANTSGQIGLVNGLWDMGSGISLILERTCRRLGLEKVSEECERISIEVVGGGIKTVESFSYWVPLYDPQNNLRYTIEAQSVDTISGELDDVNLDEAFKLFGIPPNEQGDMLFPAGEIELLIGADCSSMVLREVEQINGVRLSESDLGRVIWGSHPSFNVNSPIHHSRAVVTRTEKIGCNKNILSVPEDMVPTLFATEIMGVQCVPNCGRCACGKCSVDGDRMTPQERFEYQQVMDSITLEDGIITASYPLRKDLSTLPDNYGIALKRLIQTEHQLRKDPVAAETYQTQIQDMLDRQVLRKLTDEELSEWTGAVQYLPHHMVYKPSSTSTPARLVFDPSSQCKGKAVNDYWGRGPCLLNDQLGILYRFRENTTAIAGDISKMYNTVHTRPKEWHLHRVLWRDLDPTRPPDIYAIVRNSFGSGPAGTVAIVAKDFLAQRREIESPQAADTIKNQTFVDDILDSVKDETAARILTEQIDDILNDGSFKIKKWLIVSAPQDHDDGPNIANPEASQLPTGHSSESVNDVVAEDLHPSDQSCHDNTGGAEGIDRTTQTVTMTQEKAHPNANINQTRTPDGAAQRPQMRDDHEASHRANGSTIKVHIGSTEESILGIAWDTANDTFFFKTRINFSKRKKKIRQGPDLEPSQIFDRSVLEFLTRRSIMSQVYGLYDTLGLLVPFVVELKFALGKLWRIQDQVEWDQPVPDEHDAHWRGLFEKFFDIRSLRFPRCLSPKKPKDDPILVMMSDSSLIAFAAVAYIWVEKEDGTYFTRLIAAKSRMWPIDPDDWISIERGELQGAVLSKRLAASITKEMRVNFREVVYVIDSEIVFSQINTDSHLFNVFVGHRVAEIRSATDVQEWWLARSADNSSADLASRGTTEMSKLGQGSDWQNGPQWLRQARQTWPLRQSVKQKIVPELRCQDLVHRTLRTAVKYQSSAEQLTQPLNQAQARIYAIIQNLGDSATIHQAEINLRAFTQEQDGFLASRIDLTRHDDLKLWLVVTFRVLNAVSSPDAELLRKLHLPKVVTPEQRQMAMNFWIRQAQIPLQEAIKSGKYKSFTPFTDENCIIRLNGRFPIKPGSYHPILLPHYHPLSRLIVIMTHRRGHGGAVATASRVRADYHILQLRQLCRQIRNDCMLCRTREHRLLNVPMASLPPERIRPSYAFEHTACDIAGPFQIDVPVKPTRNRQPHPVYIKAYVVIFNCLSTRAVHLETMQGMDTDAFLLAFRRFASIRGQPKSCWSDNGGQIVAADRELQELVQSWDHERIRKFGAENGTKWEYISPGSPWANGASESLIKSVKTTFRKLIPVHQKLPIMELQTVFYEIAEILNERPISLANQGASGSDFDTETNTYVCPNQLLLGRNSVTIPPGPFEAAPLSSKNRMLANQTLVTEWWTRWASLYLPQLIAQKKWFKSSRHARVGDIVHIKDINPIRGNWNIGEIVAIKDSQDQIPRNVLIRYKVPGGNRRKPQPSRTQWRDVKNLVLIIAAEERDELKSED